MKPRNKLLFSTPLIGLAMILAAVFAFDPTGLVESNVAYAQHDSAGGHDSHGGKAGNQSKGTRNGQGAQGGKQSDVGQATGSDMEEGVMRGKGRYSDFIRPSRDDSEHGHTDTDTDAVGEDGEDEASDRPAWAGPDATAPKPGGGGNKGSITDRGDLFGDLWVVLRDPLTGQPILYVWQDTDGDGDLEPVQTADGFPQPIDAEGNLIPLDVEGHPLDDTLVVEVELGRLNIARAPDKVAARAYDEALDTLNSATAFQTDAAGRLQVLIDGEWRTIDSPLENLALYISLLDDGTIEGLTNTALAEAYPTLVDDQFDTTDVKWAATFLAAAADKVGTITLDKTMYINNIIGVEIDAADLSTLMSFTYDRFAIYSTLEATVLVDPEQDGTWVVDTVNVYQAVFEATNVTGTGATGFSQAAEDARAVVNYIHEYAVPIYDVEAIAH